MSCACKLAVNRESHEEGPYFKQSRFMEVLNLSSREVLNLQNYDWDLFFVTLAWADDTQFEAHKKG